jgi:hypothetical protein
MNPSGRRSSLANAHALPHVSTPWAYIRRDLPESNRRTKARVPWSVSQVSDLTGGKGRGAGMVSRDVEGSRHLTTIVTEQPGEPAVQARSRKPGEVWESLRDRGYNTFRGSMPNFFMREISVVRLMSMRAAAPSGPATRPFVIFRMRTI